MSDSNLRFQYFNVILPTSDGSRTMQVYACDMAKCDDCPIRFRCFTERGDIGLSYNIWCSIKDRLEWFGRHP